MTGSSRRLLNERQQRFVREFVENGGNASKAVMSAGYNTKSPQVTGSRLISNANIRERIIGLWEKKDISVERWAEILSSAMSARSKIITGPGQTEEIVDHSTRLKALDLAAKLADAYPRQAAQHEHKHLHLTQTVESAEVMRFKVLHGRAPTERELAEIQGQVIEVAACEIEQDSTVKDTQSDSQTDSEDVSD